MEKLTDFSVIKQKIIKTNELLNLYSEKTKEIQNLQKLCHQLKNNLYLSKEEANKLKVKNESLSFSLEKITSELEPLNIAHTELKLKYDKLESEYHESVNTWQIKYQTANQELRECRDELRKFEHVEAEKITKKKTSNKASAELKLERDLLREQNSELEATVQKLELKLQKLKDSESTAAITSKLAEVESELNQQRKECCILQCKLKDKDESITCYKRDLEQYKSIIEDLERENKELKDENDNLRQELGDRPENMTEVVIEAKVEEEIVINNDNKVPTDEEIKDIMKDIYLPAILTPLSELSPSDNDDESASHRALPQITQQLASSSGDFIITNYEDNIEDARDMQNLKPPRRRRRSKIIKKKKKKSKKIDLFGALLALKRAKINFTLSSDSLLHPKRIIYPPRPLRKPKSPIHEDSSMQLDNLTHKLNCNLGCCAKNSYLLLKEDSDDENRALLGFFSVKDEILSRSSSRIGNIDENIRDNKMGDELNNKTSQIKNRLRSCRRESEADSGVGSDLATEKVLGNTAQELTSELVSKKRRISEEMPDNSNKRICSRRKPNRLDNLRKKLIKHKRNNNQSFKAEINNVEAPCEMRQGRDSMPEKLVEETNQNITESLDLTNNQITIERLDKLAVEKIPPPRIITIERHEKIGKIQESLNLPSKKITIEKTVPLSPKASYKRPICRIRQSPRLASKIQPQVSKEDNFPKEKEAEIDENRPESPPPCDKFADVTQPKIIPLEKSEADDERMATSKIEVLFEKLVNFSKEEKVLNEVVEEFVGQSPEYIAQAILEKISGDIHDSADSKYPGAPILTETQRVMLGFMSRLEKTTSSNTFDPYLNLAERRLLTTKNMEEIQPITRLYLAICKLQMNIHRMRRLCCDVFYFCGDFAVPFLFTVLTSWAEVLPLEMNSQDVPLAKVLVHLVLMKKCNTPGYNLLPLRNLLVKYYGYSLDQCNSEEMFQELFRRYTQNPVRSADYVLLVFCKNHPDKWVNEKIEKFFKPLIEKTSSDNFKAAVIILIGNLSSSFDSKSEVNYVVGIKEWMKNLITDTTPDVVRRSVYLCLKRLKKK